MELALAFAREAANQGHDIHRVFFYKDAALIGSRFAEPPQDEGDTRAAWLAFAAQTQTELAICVAAGQRRGIVAGNDSSVADGFEIVGLGQMVEAMLACERTVTF